ncbi:MAG: hypothetical protein CL908_24220 [Deltaproteobacteria bacterium]|nr:hypothetical protein [Deltaproteobacteria bacterium]
MIAAHRLVVWTLLGSLLALGTRAQEYSPNAQDDFPKSLYWGDTHVHSSFSMDANSMGNTRLSPADAYRFAKGETVVANSGMEARLGQPLDFLVVSDHAEYMGLLPALRAGDERILADPAGRKLFETLSASEDGGTTTIGALLESLMKNAPIVDNTAFKRSIWSEITALADEADDPGRFTALIGFEWTSMPGGDNLHRVVVYGDGAETAATMTPVSAFDGDRPEDLWAFMERYEAEAGGRILAIPHNANVSNGRMFAIEDSNGRAFDRAYSERRARLEPIVEVTQIKGDAETHPLLSPDDEFADFETWDFGNLNVLRTVPKGEDQIEFEYARSALKLGLEQASRTGVNPFQFGMIGSTDAHTSLATGAEDDFWGKATSIEPAQRTGARLRTPDPEAILFDTWDFVASGYAAVWAQENTRKALFEAMQRREVYATSGSRIAVRFFGGWDYEREDAHRPNVARIGYRKGVPMGGTLGHEGDGSPRFLVTALKDPQGANLDRIQIVKGWREANGSLHEEVYDVAVSGRHRRIFGRTRAIRSTVDVETASYSNRVGDAMLAAYWEDPDFDPAEHAFYYARVIEIPTPRWNVYDAVRLGADVPADTPTEVQDRAYPSPIWYTP